MFTFKPNNAYLREHGLVRMAQNAKMTRSGRNVKMKRKASIHRKKPYIIICTNRRTNCNCFHYAIALIMPRGSVKSIRVYIICASRKTKLRQKFLNAPPPSPTPCIHIHTDFWVICPSSRLPAPAMRKPSVFKTTPKNKFSYLPNNPPFIFKQ